MKHGAIDGNKARCLNVLTSTVLGLGMEMKTRELPQVFGRVTQDIKDRINEEAKRNRRSQNAELGLLVEEGFKWREMQQRQAQA
jgi:hypothetical protein